MPYNNRCRDCQRCNTCKGSGSAPGAFSNCTNCRGRGGFPAPPTAEELLQARVSRPWELAVRRQPQDLAGPGRVRAGSCSASCRGQYGRALERYADAVDKVHTMSVVANPSSRIRHAGAQDQAILDGLVASCRDALAHGHDVGSTLVERRINYLLQIADESAAESSRYRRCVEELERIERESWTVSRACPEVDRQCKFRPIYRRTRES